MPEPLTGGGALPDGDAGAVFQAVFEDAAAGTHSSRILIRPSPWYFRRGPAKEVVSPAAMVVVEMGEATPS